MHIAEMYGQQNIQFKKLGSETFKPVLCTHRPYFWNGLKLQGRAAHHLDLVLRLGMVGAVPPRVSLSAQGQI
jgi:hypothetical protein